MPATGSGTRRAVPCRAQRTRPPTHVGPPTRSARARPTQGRWDNTRTRILPRWREWRRGAVGRAVERQCERWCERYGAHAVQVRDGKGYGARRGAGGRTIARGGRAGARAVGRAMARAMAERRYERRRTWAQCALAVVARARAASEGEHRSRVARVVARQGWRAKGRARGRGRGQRRARVVARARARATARAAEGGGEDEGGAGARARVRNDEVRAAR